MLVTGNKIYINIYFYAVFLGNTNFYRKIRILLAILEYRYFYKDNLNKRYSYLFLIFF
jgi:hypothetical protein